MTNKSAKDFNTDGKLYDQLRNEWNTGSQCIMYSANLKQWICTNIEEIENKNGQQILIVKNAQDINRFSNNIQPIYASDSKDNSINDKWTNLLTSEMINKSLYVTQNLLKNTENESRIKWNNGSILIIFDYKNEKW
eukprot:58683_1